MARKKGLVCAQLMPAIAPSAISLPLLVHQTAGCSSSPEHADDTHPTRTHFAHLRTAPSGTPGQPPRPTHPACYCGIGPLSGPLCPHHSRSCRRRHTMTVQAPALVTPLKDVCVRVVASNFEGCPTFGPLPDKYVKSIIDILPLDLPLELVGTVSSHPRPPARCLHACKPCTCLDLRGALDAPAWCDTV